MLPLFVGGRPGEFAVNGTARDERCPELVLVLLEDDERGTWRPATYIPIIKYSTMQREGVWA